MSEFVALSSAATGWSSCTWSVTEASTRRDSPCLSRRHSIAHRQLGSQRITTIAYQREDFVLGPRIPVDLVHFCILLHISLSVSCTTSLPGTYTFVW